MNERAPRTRGDAATDRSGPEHSSPSGKDSSEWTVAAGEAGVRLDKFLAGSERLRSRGRAVSALERGKVFVNGSEAGIADAARRLAAADVIRVWSDRPGSAKRRPRMGVSGDLDIIHEDDDLLVVNKPAGILSVPLERKPDAPSILKRIEHRFRSHRGRHAFVVHRIDQDTSGLVVFAKNVQAQQRLQAQFRQREPERVYLAVVYGQLVRPSGVWRDVIAWDERARVQKKAHPRERAGKEAISEYRVVESFAEASLLEVRLRTGRRNQIRIQASLHGHMLVGEGRYVSETGTATEIPFRRQALHALRLRFTHPADDRPLTFEAPLPADFRDLLARLRKGPWAPAQNATVFRGDRR